MNGNGSRNRDAHGGHHGGHRGGHDGICDIPKIRGFHIPAMLSSFLSWEELITEHHEAKRMAEEHDLSKLKTFVTGRWAEPWTVPSIEIKEHELLARREEYDGELPLAAKMIIGGIDTQDSSLEFLVCAIGDRHEYWMLERGSILGDLESDFDAMYGEVEQRLFNRVWTTLDGKTMRLAVATQDSAGHHSDSVYRACKRYRRKLLAYRGVPSTAGRGLYKKNRLDEHGIAMLSASTDFGKDMLFQRLSNITPGAGYIHFPVEDDWHKGFGDAFFEELTSEKKEIEWRDGRRMVRWKKRTGKAHNESLDLAVMILILYEALQLPTQTSSRIISKWLRSAQSSSRKKRRFKRINLRRLRSRVCVNAYGNTGGPACYELLERGGRKT